MFQKTKQMCRKALGFVNRIANKVTMFILMLLSGAVARAQNSAGDYTAGTNALSTVAEENAFWLNHTQIKYDKINIKLKKTRYK